MKALDTNVLIRFLVRDDERQAEAVYKIFKHAESDNESCSFELATQIFRDCAAVFLTSLFHFFQMMTPSTI